MSLSTIRLALLFSHFLFVYWFSASSMACCAALDAALSIALLYSSRTFFFADSEIFIIFSCASGSSTVALAAARAKDINIKFGKTLPCLWNACLYHCPGMFRRSCTPFTMYLKNSFGVIVWVRVVFRKTVVGDSWSHQQQSKDYPHPNDHAKQITDTPGFKPFTTCLKNSLITDMEIKVCLHARCRYKNVRTADLTVTLPLILDNHTNNYSHVPFSLALLSASGWMLVIIHDFNVDKP